MTFLFQHKYTLNTSYAPHPRATASQNREDGIKQLVKDEDHMRVNFLTDM